MTERYCKVCGGWHDLEAWPIECMPERNKSRSELPSPMLIRDEMSPLMGMHDGKMYDSKSALRASYKAHGVIEVGNDSSVMKPQPRKPKRPDRKSIRDSINRAVAETNKRHKEQLPTR
ncbi:MAG: hypothetical protein AAFP81_16855 [Pseudomonadota bacterium]